MFEKSFFDISEVRILGLKKLPLPFTIVLNEENGAGIDIIMGEGVVTVRYDSVYENEKQRLLRELWNYLLNGGEVGREEIDKAIAAVEAKKRKVEEKIKIGMGEVEI